MREEEWDVKGKKRMWVCEGERKRWEKGKLRKPLVIDESESESDEWEEDKCKQNNGKEPHKTSNKKNTAPIEWKWTLKKKIVNT